MSLLKYVNRLKRMDYLIRLKATGNATEFSKRLGISRSQLLQDLKEFRELGAPVRFCRSRQSYEYMSECLLNLEFRSRQKEYY